MAFPGRPITSNLRHPSIGGSQNAIGQSPVLVARINEKRAELENLKQLRDLSAGLAEQMENLQKKLSTLSDGTAAVAAVLSNWHNVLRAINMASTKLSKTGLESESSAIDHNKESASELPLPQTLVRIPIEQPMEGLDISNKELP